MNYLQSKFKFFFASTISVEKVLWSVMDFVLTELTCLRLCFAGGRWRAGCGGGAGGGAAAAAAAAAAVIRPGHLGLLPHMFWE